MSRFALVVAAVCAVCAPRVATASPSFPGAIQEHLGLDCAPDCTTCHTRPEGGFGTARQPFGLAMQRAGLEAGQPSKIAAALDELEAEGSDVDGDGAPDVDELRAGQSPDAADTPLTCRDDGSSDAGSGDDGGCAVSRRHAAGWSPRGVLALTLLAIGLLRHGPARPTRKSSTL